MSLLTAGTADGRSAPASDPSDGRSDADLMAAIVRGEKEALGRLYDRHAGILLALAMRILGDRTQAEDLLHDVVLEAWHRAGDFDASRGTVRAWLVTRLRSRALDRRALTTRQARLAEEAGREAAPHTISPASPPADGERIRRQLAGLPAELGAVIELAYFEGLSFSEIAQRLGVPIGTIKSRMARALTTLRQRLGGAAHPGTGGRS